MGSYTLIFDDMPNLKQASRVFQVVQRDAAWQSTLDAAYANDTLPQRSWLLHQQLSSILDTSPPYNETR
jgi:hypothetical protein